MVAISRRAILAFGAAICCPPTGLAGSIEPILRNPGLLVPQLTVSWAGEKPDPLWTTVADILPPQLRSILRDEVHKAKLPLGVAGPRLLVLKEDPYRFSPLYVKVGLKLKAVPGAEPTMGAVSLGFERLDFESVRFAQPPMHFLAANDELLDRSGDAIRKLVAAFVGILAVEDAREPTL